MLYLYAKKKFDEYMQLPKEQLAERLAIYETIFERLPPMVRYLAENFGKLCRVIRRDYVPIFGILWGIDVELKGLELLVEEDVKEWDTGKVFHEAKVLHISKGSILAFEIIEERQETQEQEKR